MKSARVMSDFPGEPATAERVQRFDPVTGKLLSDAPRFDQYTGTRLKTTPTRFWPHPPGVAWIISQTVWGLATIGLVITGFAQDVHNPGALAAGLSGVAVLYALGAAMISSASYVYRRLRRHP